MQSHHTPHTNRSSLRTRVHSLFHSKSNRPTSTATVTHTEQNTDEAPLSHGQTAKLHVNPGANTTPMRIISPCFTSVVPMTPQRRTRKITFGVSPLRCRWDGEAQSVELGAKKSDREADRVSTTLAPRDGVLVTNECVDDKERASLIVGGACVDLNREGGVGRVSGSGGEECVFKTHHSSEYSEK